MCAAAAAAPYTANQQNDYLWTWLKMKMIHLSWLRVVRVATQRQTRGSIVGKGVN